MEALEPDVERGRPAEEAGRATQHPGTARRCRARWLPGPLNTKQMLYLLFPQCLGAAILDGGANFGIAYAMYHKQSEILVWPIQHNTIAGDMAVTTFIQGVLTFLIVSGMVHRDMRIGGIAPLPHPWPRENSTPRSATHTALERHNVHLFCGSDANDVFDFSIPKGALAQRWLWTLCEGAVLSACYFLLIWPVGIAIVAPLFDGRNMAHTWASEIIKLIYGVVLGLLMNPVCALIALGSEDSVRRHYGPMDVDRPAMQEIDRVPAGGPQ